MIIGIDPDFEKSGVACRLCKKIKGIKCFYKHKTGKHGIRTECKECTLLNSKKHYQENVNVIKKRVANYRKENKGNIALQLKINRQENITFFRKREKLYYIKNIEKKLESKRIHYKKHKSTITENVKNYRKQNLDKCRALNQKRRALKNNAIGEFTSYELANLLILQQCKCVYCKSNITDKYHADHIEPLSKGGQNFIDNIQLLCPSCNSKKGAKSPFKFANQLGMLL